jgi:hypothetical protein
MLSERGVGAVACLSTGTLPAPMSENQTHFCKPVFPGLRLGSHTRMGSFRLRSRTELSLSVIQ